MEEFQIYKRWQHWEVDDRHHLSAIQRCDALQRVKSLKYADEIFTGGGDGNQPQENKSKSILFQQLGSCVLIWTDASFGGGGVKSYFESSTKSFCVVFARCRTVKQFSRVPSAQWVVGGEVRWGGGTAGPPWQGGVGRLSVLQNQVSGMGVFCSV